MPGTAYIESDEVIHGVCLGCGMCSMICPTKALRNEEVGDPHCATRMPAFQATLCVNCGNCAAVCPSNTVYQPRLRQLAFKMAKKPVHTIIFACTELGFSNSQDADAATNDAESPLHKLHAPEGTRLELVRCVHRVGPRCVDKLVQCGVRNFLLLTCPDRECRYQAHGFHRVPHVEPLQSVYDACHIPVRIEVCRMMPDELAHAQDKLDDFAAKAIVVI